MENCTEIIHFETRASGQILILNMKSFVNTGPEYPNRLRGRALGISWKTQRHGKLEKGPHTETLLYMSKFT